MQFGQSADPGRHGDLCTSAEPDSTFWNLMPSRATRTRGKEPMPDEVLTIREAGERPAFKIPEQRRIRHAELERRVDEQLGGDGDGDA